MSDTTNHEHASIFIRDGNAYMFGHDGELYVYRVAPEIADEREPPVPIDADVLKALRESLLGHLNEAAEIIARLHEAELHWWPCLRDDIGDAIGDLEEALKQPPATSP